MRAVTYTRFGPAAEVLTLTDLPDPEPGPGEVVVRVKYSGVNPSDVKARAGSRPGVTAPPYPVIVPHSDGAGVIEAVGEGVSPSRIGQRVWLWNGQWRRAFGTAAEKIALPAEQAVALGDDVDMAIGAVLGIPALTACHAVFCFGEVAGRTVLVQGGAGTVGLLAVQLAKWGGAKVIATARGEGAARAAEAGADAVVDFSDPDLAARILAANGGMPVDHIVEVEFGLNADTDAEVIAENGTLCAYGSARAMRPEMPFYTFMFKAVRMEAALIYLLPPAPRAAAIGRLARALRNGALTCPVAKILPLGACAEAHALVEAGGRHGAILLDTGACID